MNTEAIQKAIELIDKSEHVAVFLPENPDLDCLAAAEVLTNILEERGKQTGFPNKPVLESEVRRKHFAKLAAAEPSPKEFVISLDTRSAPISQLRYEKTDERVDVIFSPKSSSLKSDLVSFRDGKVLCDCAVMLGIPDLDSFQGSDRVSPEFFTETSIINIDISEKNKNYGEVNLGNGYRVSISEIIYEFSSIFCEKPINKEMATVLLAGLLNKTGNFQDFQTNADTLLTASELLRLGADKKEAGNIAKEIKSISLTQLFSRAFIRTKVSEDQKITWSFLTNEDFEKTGRTAEDVGEVLSSLGSAIPTVKVLVLFWQDLQGKIVQAILAGDGSTLLNLSTREPGEFQKQQLKITRVFSTFREAEDYLNSLLKELV